MTSPTLPLLPLAATIALRIPRHLRNGVEFHVNWLPKHSSEPHAREAVVDQTRLSRCPGTRSLMRFSPEERPPLFPQLVSAFLAIHSICGQLLTTFVVVCEK